MITRTALEQCSRTIRQTRALGYMQVTADATPQEVAAPCAGIETCASARQLTLLGVLVETIGGGTSAFADLVEALCERDAGTVIVPALEHFAHIPGLRQALINILTEQAAALVLVASLSQELPMLKAQVHDAVCRPS